MSGKTHIRYTDTALPTTSAAVTLFDSTRVTPGWFHLLNQEWYQWALSFDSAGDAATGTVTGQYSEDKGSTWNTFYTSGSLANDTHASDEVYIGMFKDVRFTFTISDANATAFRVNQSLSCYKPTSKVTAAHVLHDDDAAAGSIDIVDVTPDE
jgi:hypothetical protein